MLTLRSRTPIPIVNLTIMFALQWCESGARSWCYSLSHSLFRALKWSVLSNMAAINNSHRSSISRRLEIHANAYAVILSFTLFSCTFSSLIVIYCLPVVLSHRVSVQIVFILFFLSFFVVEVFNNGNELNKKCFTCAKKRESHEKRIVPKEQKTAFRSERLLNE